MSRGFEDGEHILYVNGEFRGESEIGELMYGFKGNQLREPYSKYGMGMTLKLEFVPKSSVKN